MIAGRVAGVVPLLLVALLAGCGGDAGGVATLTGSGGSSTPTASSDGSGGTDEEKALQFAKCMRDNGIKDFPDPEVDANGNVSMGFRFREGENGPPPDREVMDKAFQACEEYAPRQGPRRLTDEQRAEVEDAMLAYAKCMRENGVDMPDPNFAGGPQRLEMRPDGDEATFRKADEACRDKLQPLEDIGGGPRRIERGK